MSVGTTATRHHPPGWRVKRVDLRSPVSDHAWPIARVEFEHPARGRVTEIASAPGALEAAFAAAAHALGVAPTLSAYSARSAARDLHGVSVSVEIAVILDGFIGCGDDHGPDLIKCSVEAWLVAAGAALEARNRQQPAHSIMLG